MRVSLLLFFGAVTSFSYGQSQYSIAYYVDQVVALNHEEKYSVDDVMSQWDDYLRLQSEHALSPKSIIRAWLDLDATFTPYNMEVAYIRNLGILRPEILLRRNKFYTSDYTNYPDSYNNALAINQIGAGITLKQSKGIFSYEVCPQFTLGTVSKQVKLNALRQDSTNFRAVDEAYFKIKGFRSFGILANMKLRIISRKNWELHALYEFNVRRDWFKSENQTRRYEWTHSNVVHNDTYSIRHQFDRIQNRFGLFLSYE